MSSAASDERYGGYALQAGDADGRHRYGGERRVAPELLPGAHEMPYVEQLRADLRTLGFAFVGEGGTFTSRVRWGVREFQAYAKMPCAAREPEGASGTYATRLEQVKSNAQYDGPVSGVVNASTRAALAHWLDHRWRCPVVVSAWTAAKGKPIAIYDGQENVWQAREVTSESVRMFVRDLSGHYDRPAEHRRSRMALGRHHTLGSRPWGGPLSLPPEETWPEAEVLPQTLIGPGPWGAATLSTFMVIRAVSEVECCGYLDCVNAYDNAFMSVGPCHWTLGIASDAKDRVAGGELCGYLAYLHEADPAAFEKAVGSFGIAIDTGWGTKGQALFDADLRIFTAWLCLEQDDGSYAALDDSVDEAEHLRTWHWFYRFVMAGRTVEGFRHRMWDMARMRIRDILTAPWRPSAGVPDVSDGQGGSRSAMVGDVFTSQRAVALLVRWHVRAPEQVVRHGHAAGSLEQAAKTVSADAATWTSADQAALAAAIVSQAIEVSESGDDLEATLNEVNSWPTWAPGGNNPRTYRFSPPAGGLSLDSGSFAFDEQGLPPAIV